jgi:hypothetical protein
MPGSCTFEYVMTVGKRCSGCCAVKLFQCIRRRPALVWLSWHLDAAVHYVALQHPNQALARRAAAWSCGFHAYIRRSQLHETSTKDDSCYNSDPIVDSSIHSRQGRPYPLAYCHTA